jgi:hypothetical protein
MLSDPRRGLHVSLILVFAAGLWLSAQWPLGDRFFDMLGYAVYTVDLVAILVLTAGLLVALLFARYLRVKQDLLAGRKVIARWQADPVSFRAFAGVADARDDSDKRSVLLLVLGFIVVIFCGFALADKSAAPAMLSTGAVLSLVMVLSYALGRGIRRKQLEAHSLEVIVGFDGLLVNDVLHVWRTPVSWFVSCRIEPGPPGLMTMTYAFVARSGAQFVEVLLPVPDHAMQLALQVQRSLRHTR